MDFHAGEGVTVEQARTLTGMLRSALYNTSEYTLINREDMEAIAQNHKIELIFCDDDACLLQIGSLLGAQKLVAGDIGIVVGEFVVNARLVDIGSRALVNECVATRRSDRSAAALQLAMEDLATELTGGKLPRAKGPRTLRTEDLFDGSILRLEGETILLSLRRPGKVWPRSILEVLRPPSFESDGSRPDSVYRHLARPIGKLRVVAVTASQATAYSESPLTSLNLEAGYPVRIFRTHPWISLEPFVQYTFSRRGSKIDAERDRYLPSEPGILDSHIRLDAMNTLEGPSAGASLQVSPVSWFQVGLRGIVGWIYNRTGEFEYVHYRPPDTLKGKFHISHEATTQFGAAVRVKRAMDRGMDAFVEGEVLHIGWGSTMQDLLDIGDVDPPTYLGAVRVGIIRHSSSRFGYLVAIGATQSMGGDWSTSGVNLTLAPAFGF